MRTGNFVAYYRVSTTQQGRSGLGIEAQVQAVQTYLNGGGGELRAEFTEVESGRNNDRPELWRALAACKMYRARLLVAKLDRLSRDARFLMGLKDQGVRFVIADLPEANDLTIELLAVLAQHESRLISERTRSALAAAKRRANPPTLGGHPERISRAASRRGAAISATLRRERATEHALAFAEHIAELQKTGITSLRQIAAEMNRQGVPAPRGGQWRAEQVTRLLKRIDAAR